MKVVLLTTDTFHHTYFACKVAEHIPLEAIFVENRQFTPSFDTFHPFETLRDTYEREVLLGGFHSLLSEVTQTWVFESINDGQSISRLQALSPDVLIVFGAGKLLMPVIQMASIGCLNLHGGNPEQYRGLDSHLWAIYHRDFGNLITTLHYVDDGLDTGNIVFQSQLKLSRESKLHELRSINTKMCVDLSLLALKDLTSVGSLKSRKQACLGRYYSFMPSPLKEDCVRKFASYVAKL